MRRGRPEALLLMGTAERDGLTVGWCPPPIPPMCRECRSFAVRVLPPPPDGAQASSSPGALISPDKPVCIHLPLRGPRSRGWDLSSAAGRPPAGTGSCNPAYGNHRDFSFRFFCLCAYFIYFLIYLFLSMTADSQYCFISVSGVRVVDHGDFHLI